MPYSVIGEINMLLEYGPEFQALCARPYLGHPRGCPNRGKRDTCPPRAPLIDGVLDLSQQVYVVATRFDLGAHVGRMRNRHPDWSERQLYCCLYWQGTARKIHREDVKWARGQWGIRRVVPTPEGHGVNVTALMAALGVTLEWPPRRMTWVVSLGGSPI